jgi:hypothetical protein
MEKIDDHVRTEILYKVMEDRNILHTIKRKHTNWIGHILHMNGLLKHISEGNTKGRTEAMGR